MLPDGRVIFVGDDDELVDDLIEGFQQERINTMLTTMRRRRAEEDALVMAGLI